MCIMLSDELRSVRNEGSCGLMYLSMLYRFSALLQFLKCNLLLVCSTAIWKIMQVVRFFRSWKMV